MSTTLFDNNFQQLEESVTKALMGIEMPLKDKHARSIIIGTHRYQGSAMFWVHAFKQPILKNKISAWKFCHLLYRILREGHNLCCKESQQSIKYLTDLGIYWSSLKKNGYGICISKFAKLLKFKIEFHIRNSKFPGSLSVPRAEIEQIGGGDINSLYQLTSELYDYLDAVIELQANVFSSLKTHHINSMTLAGQCRLAGLIPCIEEANLLYDLVERFMFKLHEHLSNDMLDGHRQRFKEIFRQLHMFYQQSNDLQYFVNLLIVPKLTCELPNFTCNREYESNILVVPKGTSVWENLAAMTESVMLCNGAPEQQEPNRKPSDYFDHRIRERDDVLKQTQNELATARALIEFNEQQYLQNVFKLHNQMIMLRDEIYRKDNILLAIQQEKEILEEKANSERSINERDDVILQMRTELFTIQREKHILEEKIQKHDKEISEVEEKFAKLLPLYMETRTDHINLLQQNQETNKAMRELKKSFEQLEIDKANVEKELTEMKRKYETRQKLHSNWDLRKI